MTKPIRPRRRDAREHVPALVQAWRWRIAAASRPVPLMSARWLCEAVRDAVARNAWTIGGSARLPVCLHGPDEPQNENWRHGHAFYLPEDADGDGLIEHLTVCAGAGLDPRAIRLLAATDRLIFPGGDWAVLMAERMCRADGLPKALVGPARLWESLTPYVPPNDRPRFDLRDAARQLRSEARNRSLGAEIKLRPEPLVAIAIGGRQVAAGDFDLRPGNGECVPSGAAPAFFRLEFEAPVLGPLAFGWACHGGLGAFRAVE